MLDETAALYRRVWCGLSWEQQGDAIDEWLQQQCEAINAEQRNQSGTGDRIHWDAQTDPLVSIPILL